MMSFQFKRLINKYKVPITVTRTSNSQSGPRVTETTETYTTECAVFNPDPAEIENYEALQYVSNAIKVYAVESLTAVRQSDDTEVSFEIQQNDTIAYNGENYEVLDKGDRTEHSDFIMYMASKEVVE